MFRCNSGNVRQTIASFGKKLGKMAVHPLYLIIISERYLIALIGPRNPTFSVNTSSKKAVTGCVLTTANSDAARRAGCGAV